MSSSESSTPFTPSVATDVFANHLFHACLSSVAEDGSVQSKVIYALVQRAFDEAPVHFTVRENSIKFADPKSGQAIQVSDVRSLPTIDKPGELCIIARLEIKGMQLDLESHGVHGTLHVKFKGSVRITLECSAFPRIVATVQLENPQPSDWDGTELADSWVANLINAVSKIQVFDAPSLREFILDRLAKELAKPHVDTIELLKPEDIAKK